MYSAEGYDTDVPSYYELTADEWKEAVVELREQLEDEVVDVLEEVETPDEAEDDLQTLFEPYLSDDPDSTAIQLWAEADGDELYMGVWQGNWIGHKFDDERGFWWDDYEDPPEQIESSEEAHRRIAEQVLQTTHWGDPRLRDQVAQKMDEARERADAYLQSVLAIEEEVEGPPSARALREPLRELLRACNPIVRDDDNRTIARGEEVEIRDESPGPERTEFVVGAEDEEFGVVIAVPPGEDWMFDAIVDDEERKVLVTTNHYSFDVPHRMPAEEGGSTMLVPYNERDERFETYSRRADNVVSYLDSAMNMYVDESN